MLFSSESQDRIEFPNLMLIAIHLSTVKTSVAGFEGPSYRAYGFLTTCQINAKMYSGDGKAIVEL